MNRLLSIFVDVWLPLIILVIAIIGSIFLYKIMKKKFNTPSDITLKLNPKPQVKLKEYYATEDEMEFLMALHKALPRECIAFPNVGLSKIIEPKGSLIEYKYILDKFVDVCIFLRKTMKPILVVDLYQSSPAAQQLKKFDSNVSNILKEVKIPIIKIEIQEKYQIDNLKMQLLQAMNSDTVTFLKDKIIDNSVNKL